MDRQVPLLGILSHDPSQNPGMYVSVSANGLGFGVFLDINYVLYLSKVPLYAQYLICVCVLNLSCHKLVLQGCHSGEKKIKTVFYIGH